MQGPICNICKKRLQRFRSHEMICYRCREVVCRTCKSKDKTSKNRVICRKCEGAFN